MSVAGTLLAMVVPLALGTAVLWASGLRGTAHIGVVVGAAFGVGIGLITATLAVFPLVGLPLRPGVGIPAVSLVGATVAILIHRIYPLASKRESRGAVASRKLDRPASVLWWLGMAGLIVKISLITWRAMDKPVMAWDAFIVHSFRAKMMYFDHAWSGDSLRWIGNADYPLGIPLAELWVTWFQTGWNDTAFKILFPMFLVALLALAYGGLRDVFGPCGAMLGTWVIAGLPLLSQHATDGYLDLPLAYSTFGTFLLLWRFARLGHRRDLVVASGLASLGVWMKDEGSVTVAFAVLSLVVWDWWNGRLREGNAWRDIGRFAALPIAVWIGWAMFKLASGITPRLTVNPVDIVSHLDRVQPIVEFTVMELFRSANWHVVWPLFFGGWLLTIRSSFGSDFLFLGWPVVLTLAALLGVSQSTVMFQYLFQGTTLHRIMLHVAPLAAFWVALMIGRQWMSLRTTHKV